MATKKFPLLLIILLLAFISFFSLFSNVETSWKIWNIPVCPPHFADVDMMTMGAESHAMGYDPLYNNPVHPWNKKLNYPRIWHVLFALGIDRSDNNLIGIISIFLFYIGLGVFLFSGKYDKLTVFVISLLVLSPSVMLGMERGNIELGIFFVLSIALLVNYYSSMAALPLFLFAGILKIYPAFTFMYLLKENQKKFWILFLSASAVFIIYLLFTLQDLKQIYLTTPKIPKSAYGLNVLWMGLTHPHILNLQLSENVILAARVLSYVMFAAVFIITMLLSFKTDNSRIYKQGRYLDSFRVGAAIFIGCFILGSNFDYRFTFLIFTVPQLISWLYREDGKISPVVFVMVSAIVYSCWNYTVNRIVGVKLGFLIEEMSNWVVLSGLLYLFFASLPVWFDDYLYRPFIRLGLAGSKDH